MVTEPRIYGHHEAGAMFDAVYNTLAVIGTAGTSAGGYVRELQAERDLLLKDRLALARLYDACQTENFNRPNGEMSTNLRAALRLAKEALDG